MKNVGGLNYRPPPRQNGSEDQRAISPKPRSLRVVQVDRQLGWHDLLAARTLMNCCCDVISLARSVRLLGWLFDPGLVPQS